MPTRNSWPAGAPRQIRGAPSHIPGAPQFVPGGPSRSFTNFMTTVTDQPSSGAFRDLHTRQVRDFQGRFAGPNGIAWQGLDVISERLFEYGEKVEEAYDRAAEQLKDEMVAHMKASHPWENRTGNAEEGLQGHVISGNGRIVIWIGHGYNVPYGIWLEIMQGGRFAVVLPTLLLFAPQIHARVRGMV